MQDLPNVPGADIIRPKYTYSIPNGALAGSPVDGFGKIASVTLTVLTGSDELLATSRAKGDAIRLGYEMAKQAVIGVNGKPVSAGDGSLDIFWERCHSSLRTMIVSAYTKLNQPEANTLDSFLKSCKVEV